MRWHGMNNYLCYWTLQKWFATKWHLPIIRMMVDNYKLPISPDDWIRKSKEKYDSLFPDVSCLPGVTKLVHHLAKHKIPIAVASSSSTSSFKLKTMKHSGLFSMFDAIVLGDDPRVLNAKPSPDIFQVKC